MRVEGVMRDVAGWGKGQIGEGDWREEVVVGMEVVVESRMGVICGQRWVLS
jgi:hypothetical protein